MTSQTWKVMDERLDEEAQQALLESELADIELSEPEVDEEFSQEIKAMKAADRLWDDDDLPAEEQAKAAAEEAPLEGNHEIPMDHLYFVKPLKSKDGKAVMTAIQEIILQLKQENLPVTQVNSDRAHEMRSPALRAWMLDNGIWLTRTEGQAPESSGSAERAVRFLKRRLGTAHWDTAMEAAAHRQCEERLRPEDPQLPCPCGTRAAIKKKRYGDGGRHDLLLHWRKGTCMGPVWDSNGGSAVLEDETNSFTITTHLRARLHDPGALKHEQEINEADGKGCDWSRWPSGEKFREGQCGENPGDFSEGSLDLLANDPAHKVKRPQLANEDAVGEASYSYCTVGAYNFGGKFSITKYTQEAPQLTEKVTQLRRIDLPDEVFASATIVRNASMPTHKDSFNERHSHNLISSSSPFDRKLTGDMREELFENGFVLPDEARLKALQEEAEQTKHMEFEVDEDELIESYDNKDSAVEVDEDIERCAKAAAENLYARGIEKVLAELEGDLRVVHTVHPGEVEEAIEEWIPALSSEVNTLEYIKAVKPLRGQAARDYMGDNEIKYSGGAVAEAVRLGIAEASSNRWSACTGDIVSAFLRAVVPEGTTLALKPPAALVKAGLAEAGEIWVVQTALYGQADADVWQIKGPDHQSIVGLMIVHVDDLFSDDAYARMATSWEVTPCQYASPSTSVFFLGMEIKQEVDNEGKITGYSLGQEGYIEEVLHQHNAAPTEKSLLPSAKEWMTMDPKGFPTTYSQEQLVAAQSITGALAYLSATKQWKLMFHSGSRPELVTYADSSYSPRKKPRRSRAVAWKSSRHSLVTTSSAETELLSASEGATLTYAIDAGLSDVGVFPSSKEIRVDNSAAITLASEEWLGQH
ncbi:GIP [Symbiodinium sp. CCMP2592]|nr:GIP [Symbiodinium sp. CCMP2592]